MRLLIADDHAVVRKGIRQVLETQGDIDVAGEAVDGDQVLDALNHELYDLVLLDLSMPGVNGVELIQRIREQWPGQRILVFSMHEEAQMAAQALKAGTDGYITKDSDPDVILSAIYKVASGGKYIDSKLAEAILFEGESDSDEPHEKLSNREIQILRMLADGKTVTEIADELALSAKTVSTHKMRLMKKMNISNNADLYRYVLEHAIH